jgi:hypothetical protein
MIICLQTGYSCLTHRHLLQDDSAPIHFSVPHSVLHRLQEFPHYDGRQIFHLHVELHNSLGGDCCSVSNGVAFLCGIEVDKFI